MFAAELQTLCIAQAIWLVFVLVDCTAGCAGTYDIGWSTYKTGVFAVLACKPHIALARYQNTRSSVLR